MMEVINHYNEIPNNAANTNLDNRLRPGGNPQRLNLSNNEKLALEAFIKTLTGSDIYTNEKWSNPFDENGNINLSGNVLTTNNDFVDAKINIYPNPVSTSLNINIVNGNYGISIYNINGAKVLQSSINGSDKLNLFKLKSGIYFLILEDLETNKLYKKKFIKK